MTPTGVGCLHHLLQFLCMPRRSERSPIPGWAERERSGDLLWIMANLHVLWPAAQNAYASEGRGAIVVDLTTRLGTGTPFPLRPESEYHRLR